MNSIMSGIIDAEQAQQKKPMMKMVFHFSRILDSDIPVEGADYAECVSKAIAERMKACTPMKIAGEVVE